MKITIYQEKNPTFRVDETKKEYSKLDYHKVYETNARDYCGNNGIEHKVLLNMLFEDFNIGRYPSSYKGHSMSVGDIVKLDNICYICCSFGWNEIKLV